MDAQTLLENFAAIADSPRGIHPLRALVLELAIRGQLVEQDPADEAVAVLLDRVEAARVKAIKERGLRGASPRAIAESEKPWAIPSTWAWVRLDQLALPQAGFAFKSSRFNEAGHGTPLIRIRDIGNGTTQCHYDGDYRSEFLVESGDYLVGMDGNFNIRRWSGPTALLNQRVTRLVFFGEQIERSFVTWALQNRINNVHGSRAYTTVQHLSGKQIADSVVPVPPLQEQRRIVERVDQLMGLCDELESRRGRRQYASSQLRRSVLHSLTDAGTAEGTRHAWDRISAKWPTFGSVLTDSVEALGEFRDAIVRLAVEGKLTFQDSEDEPASDLLERIATSRSSDGQSNDKRRGAQVPSTSNALGPFPLPSGWAWTTFGNIGEIGRGRSQHRPRNDPSLYSNGTFPLIQTGDVARSGGSITTYTALYNDLGVAQSRLWPKGTLCITIAANIADSGFLTFDACFPDSVVGFTPHPLLEEIRFLELFIRTAKSRLEMYAPSTAQKNINLAVLDALLIPLPPINEQRRILSIVDQLMKVCDKLEASLLAQEKANVAMSGILLRMPDRHD